MHLVCPRSHQGESQWRAKKSRDGRYRSKDHQQPTSLRALRINICHCPQLEDTTKKNLWVHECVEENVRYHSELMTHCYPRSIASICIYLRQYHLHKVAFLLFLGIISKCRQLSAVRPEDLLQLKQVFRICSNKEIGCHTYDLFC